MLPARSDRRRILVMAKPKRVVCTNCFYGQEHVLKRTFLGFHKFTCSLCETPNKYPLTNSYVVIYAIAAFFFVAGTILAFFGQGAPTCVVLGIGGLIALGYDFGIRRKARHARDNEKTRDQIRAEPFQ